jgi:hypothetical protein
MKRIPTPAERRKFNEYRRRGYTMVIWDRDNNMVPGYSDWILADVLAALELDDTMVQIQLRCDSVNHACITETTNE